MNQDRKDNLDHLEIPEQMEELDYQENKDQRAQLDHQETRDLLGLQEKRDHPDLHQKMEIQKDQIQMQVLLETHPFKVRKFVDQMELYMT